MSSPPADRRQRLQQLVENSEYVGVRPKRVTEQRTINPADPKIKQDIIRMILQYLQEGSMFIHVYVNPFVDPPKDEISTNNPAIKAKMMWLMGGKQGPCPEDGSATMLTKPSLTVNKLNFAKASAGVWGKISAAMEEGKTTCEISWAEQGISDADVQKVLVDGLKVQLGCTVTEADGKLAVEWAA